MSAPTIAADPRTEIVIHNARDVDHIYCEECWTPGTPMMCGAFDNSADCPDNCGHVPCPMCEIEWENHVRDHVGSNA